MLRAAWTSHVDGAFVVCRAAWAVGQEAGEERAREGRGRGEGRMLRPCHHQSPSQEYWVVLDSSPGTATPPETPIGSRTLRDTACEVARGVARDVAWVAAGLDACAAVWVLGGQAGRQAGGSGAVGGRGATWPKGSEQR